MSFSSPVADDPELEGIDPQGQPPAKRRLPWKRIFAGLFALFVLMVAWLAWTAPLGRALEPLDQPALVLLDDEGTPFARRGDFKEEPVDIAKLPPHVIDAVLSTEDRRFYDHIGIDIRGLSRAFLANMQAGEVVQGGSTVTQQLAKTSFLTHERSYRRKAQEVIIALWLETWLTKDEILSRYLSSVYFGEGAYGLRAAARTYFDREPESLTLAQSAMLAGIIKAPSALAPSRHLKRAQDRSEVVLQTMVDAGTLTQAQADRTRPATFTRGRPQLPTGSYFADWVMGQAREEMDGRHYGEVRVRTTLDPELQAIAEKVVREATDGPGTWLHANQGALIAMRPDGRVVAMVGGRSYKDNQYNRAAQAKRQPGSSFKLFVYLAALRNGYDPNSTVDDTPVEIDGWKPRNDEGKYRGPGITLYRAVAASSNVAAARITQDVGTREVIRVARDLGVKSYLNPWPALSLGTSRMTLLELTSAYAAVAAERYPITPIGLADRQPGWRERVSGAARATRGFPEAADMKKLLEVAVARGTGNSARLPGVDAYGKTGTTQNFRDALFVGFAGDLIVGVWFGNDDNSPMNGVTGRGLPAETWRKFMMQALPQLRTRAAAASNDDDGAEEGDEIDTTAELNAASAAALEELIGQAAAVGGEEAAAAIEQAREQIQAAAQAAEEATREPQQ
ncbi:transglycosylase domain-containing protein [Sphingoaurantiacus capsulatus]|uniref:peptidoglycan glycosyltransferase n=1 Tax=Sphingoaurantiacus capsulatus TaxID=1771310 RepID=A0ABV7X9U6_9SPHN